MGDQVGVGLGRVFLWRVISFGFFKAPLSIFKLVQKLSIFPLSMFKFISLDLN